MTQQISSESIAQNVAPVIVRRPGVVVAAAVLGIVQAVMSVFSTMNVVTGLLAAADVGGAVGPAWIGVLAQVVGIVLLVVGAVKLLRGTGRSALVAGAWLQIAIILFYIVSSAITGHLIPIDALVSVAFAAIPVAILVLARGARATAYLDARRA